MTDSSGGTVTAKSDTVGEYTWHCVYFTDENSKKSFALDANEIVSVSCNGTDLI